MDKLKGSVKEQVSKAKEAAAENKAVAKADTDMRMLLLQQFTPNEKVAGSLAVDKNNHIFKLPGLTNLPYKFDELRDFELQEDGATVTSGGVGRAVAFGALTGGVGAIVGGITGRKTKDVVNELKIKLNINTSNEIKVEYITLIPKPVKRKSNTYKVATKTTDQILALLQYIVDNNSDDEVVAQEVQAAVSPADELRKYKSLLDDGIITQDEFNKKKSELLG
ncbi:SHOCT domain-containing protein [Periweissella cryptocerci]|nr:SHOCT domain-containing protein [Periweissella cryptocerci]